MLFYCLIYRNEKIDQMNAGCFQIAWLHISITSMQPEREKKASKVLTKTKETMKTQNKILIKQTRPFY